MASKCSQKKSSSIISLFDEFNILPEYGSYCYQDFLVSEKPVSIGYQFAACIDFINKFDEYMEYEDACWYSFVELLSNVLSTDFADIFCNSNAISTLDKKTRVRWAKETLIDFIETKTTRVINNGDSRAINKLYRAYCFKSQGKCSKRLLNSIEGALATYFESSFTKGLNVASAKRIIDLANTLDIRILRSDVTYESFLTCCGKICKLLPKADANLLSELPTLVMCLKNIKDKYEIISAFNAYCKNLVLIENINKNTYDRLETLHKIIALNNAHLRENRDSNPLERYNYGRILYADMVLALYNLGPEKYKEYTRLVKLVTTKNDLPINLYELCSFIASDHELSVFKIPFTNLIIHNLAYNEEYHNLCRLFTFWDELSNQEKEVKYDALRLQYNDKIPSEQEIEKFVNNYYALSILHVELVEVFKCIIDGFENRRWNRNGRFGRLAPRGGKQSAFVSKGSTLSRYISKCDQVRKSKIVPHLVETVPAGRIQRQSVLDISDNDKLQAANNFKYRFKVYVAADNLLAKAQTADDYFQASQLFNIASGIKDASEKAHDAAVYGRRRQQESAYSKAWALEQTDDIANLEAAAQLYATICDYQDSANRKIQCKSRAQTLRTQKRYNDIMLQYSSATTEQEYFDIALLFLQMGAYQNAPTMAKKCKENAETCRKDAILSNAEVLVQMHTVDSLNQAISLYGSITGWRDADNQKKKASDILDEIKAEVYELAKNTADKATSADDFRYAVDLLESVRDFADAEDLIKQYLGLADEFWKRETFAKAVDVQIHATSERAFRTAADLFDSLGDYHNAAQLKEMCEQGIVNCRNRAATKFAKAAIVKVRTSGIPRKQKVHILDKATQILTDKATCESASALITECNKLKDKFSDKFIMSVCAGIIAVIAVVVAVGMGYVVYQTPSTYDASLSAQAKPATSQIASNVPENAKARITIQNRNNMDAYIKIKEGGKDGDEVATIFISRGDNIQISLPKGFYYAAIGLGDTWFGVNDAFGKSGSYYSFGTRYACENHSYFCVIPSTLQYSQDFLQIYYENF